MPIYRRFSIWDYRIQRFINMRAWNIKFRIHLKNVGVFFPFFSLSALSVLSKRDHHRNGFNSVRKLFNLQLQRCKLLCTSCERDSVFCVCLCVWRFLFLSLFVFDSRVMQFNMKQARAKFDGDQYIHRSNDIEIELYAWRWLWRCYRMPIPFLCYVNSVSFFLSLSNCYYYYSLLLPLPRAFISTNFTKTIFCWFVHSFALVLNLIGYREIILHAVPITLNRSRADVHSCRYFSRCSSLSFFIIFFIFIKVCEYVCVRALFLVSFVYLLFSAY